MKKFLIFFGGLIVLSSLCSFLGFLFDTRSPGTKIAHKICAQIGKYFNKKYGLQFMGISEQGSDGKYVTIGLELCCKRILSKDEGRVLLLNCGKDAVDAFNSHEEFKQYMANVPFTSRNIILNIFIQPPKNPDVYYPDITVFTFYNEFLYYKMNSPEQRQSYKYFKKEKETYEEALKIVEAQQRGELPFVRNN